MLAAFVSGPGVLMWWLWVGDGGGSGRVRVGGSGGRFFFWGGF